MFDFIIFDLFYALMKWSIGLFFDDKKGMGDINAKFPCIPVLIFEIFENQILDDIFRAESIFKGKYNCKDTL